ncbi:HEAT repeat domain-containing protein [Engelhardtia mirabilis]
MPGTTRTPAHDRDRVKRGTSRSRLGPAGLLLALAAGCSTPEGPKRVSFDQLPPEYRAALAAYDEGGETWSATREQALANPDLARFLVDNLSVKMVRSFETAKMGSPEARNFPFQRAQSELVLMAQYSLPLMTGMVATDDEILAHLGAETCARIGVSALEPAIELLGHERSQVRRRAADLLGRLPSAGEGELELIAALARTASDDPDWVVRAQAVRALTARAGHQLRIGALREALERATRDRDPAVAGEGARGLGHLGDLEAIPTLLSTLERAYEDGEMTLWNDTQDALVALAGGPKRDLAGWRQWSKDQRRQDRNRR